MPKRKTPSKSRSTRLGKTRIPFSPGDDSDELLAIQTELEQQTDRGAALLGGAFLEWRVKQAISTRLKIWDENATRIFGTDDRPGELGFLDQCRMAYCLGLVGTIGLKDLEVIAKIRNRFAHHFKVRSFDRDQKVRDFCTNLGSPAEHHQLFQLESTIEPTIPRARFKLTVNLLSSMLWLQATKGVVRWPFTKSTYMSIFW